MTSSPGQTAPNFRVSLRGYDRRQVDTYLHDFAKHALGQGEPPSPPAFEVVLRGYDAKEVDAFVRQLADAPREVLAGMVLDVDAPGVPGAPRRVDGVWEYRPPQTAFAVTAGTVGVIVTVGAVAAGTSDDNPPAVRVLVPLLLLGLLALFLWLLRRTGTYVSRDGIVTYGVLRRTEIRWKEIQDIKAKEITGSTVVVVRTSDGRERRLPQLDDRHYPVPDEVKALRAIWEKRRGPGWKQRRTEE
ncbi:DivIVA domain-containing protein [Actinomadura adrarensis]|uniref:DivIVA domain-containing protein n=1 Tax=Actinomadura adrarensis TaxID=1819600 RepID=A0ABW3CMT5_9ACTN